MGKKTIYDQIPAKSFLDSYVEVERKVDVAQTYLELLPYLSSALVSQTMQQSCWG